MGNGKSKIILIAFALLNYSVFAQNLIENGSFEEHTKCPDTFDDIKFVSGWEESTKFSVDYYNTCGIDCVYIYRPFNANRNQHGVQKARTGNGYAGFFAYNEFLTTKLLEKLELGKQYFFEAYVNLSDLSEEAAKYFGFLFTSEQVTRLNIDKFKSNAHVIYLNYIEDKKAWIQISGIYTANGTEEFLTIGNFIKKPEYKKVSKTNCKTDKCASYYFIDDITFISIIKNQKKYNNSEIIIDTITEKINQKFEVDSFKYDKILNTFILEDIYFETDKYELLSSSFPILNQLDSFLKKNNVIMLSINGFTDNEGNETYNIELSKKRAKSIADYLIQKGIDKNKITFNGYGSSNPIASNNSEIGRRQNRRVEIKFFH